MGHTEEISTLALQHDGLILASASGPTNTTASQICLWNLKDGVCKKVCINYFEFIVNLYFNRGLQISMFLLIIIYCSTVQEKFSSSPKLKSLS